MPAVPFRAPGLDAPAKPLAKHKREVNAVLGQIAEQAARIPDPYLHELVPVLAQAQKELRADLVRWLADIKDGGARFTAQQYRSAILQLKSAFEVIDNRVPASLQAILREANVDAGETALAHLQVEVARMAGIFGHSVRPLQLDQAAILAQVEHQLIPRFRNSANRYADGIADDIRRQLAVGVIRGETFSQLTNRLVRMGGPRGWVALRGTLGEPGSYAEYISEGLFRRYRGWAERIVQTEVLHSYNFHSLTGIHAANQEDPGYQAMWCAILDRSCPACMALDGKIVDPGDAFARLPGDRGPVLAIPKAPPRAPRAKSKAKGAPGRAPARAAVAKASQAGAAAAKPARKAAAKAVKDRAADRTRLAEERAAAKAQAAQERAVARAQATAERAKARAEARAAASAERTAARAKAAEERARATAKAKAERDAARVAEKAARAAERAEARARAAAERAASRAAAADARAKARAGAKAAAAKRTTKRAPRPTKAAKPKPSTSFKQRSGRWAKTKLGVPELSREEVAAVTEYSGPLHQEINGKLRGVNKRRWNEKAEVKLGPPGGPILQIQSESTLGEMRDRLDSAISKSTVPDDMLTFRGLIDHDGKLSKLKPGDSIVDPGYKSTTLLGFEQARRFAGVGTARLQSGERVVFTIEVPKGSKALFLSGVLDKHKTRSGMPVEAQEVLLPRKTKFEVLGVETIGDTRSIRVRAK